MNWTPSVAAATIITGFLVMTVPVHSAQLVEHDRCQIEVDPNATDETDPVSFDSLTTAEQRGITHAIQTGRHRFACPSDPTLDYAGDVTYSNSIEYNNTTYTVVTSYDDALFPDTFMKQAMSVVLGIALVGIGLLSISSAFRD
ncbi:MAG: hypothetical protein ABEH81_14515 [Halopenitus sp.]